MSTKDNATSSSPGRSMTGLAGLGDGIVREAEALDASLDRAFSSLREIRTASNRLVAPASQSAADSAGSARGVPEGQIKDITDRMRDVAARIYETLNQAGAAPAVDSAARKTADGMESAAEKLEDELSAWGSATQMPPDTVACVLSDCRSEAQGLQRRISAPVGKLMSIMQLRDNMDQRTVHVAAAADIGLNVDGNSRTLVEVCLNAQLDSMSGALRDGGEAINGASVNIRKVTSSFRTQLAMTLAARIVPGTCGALEIALSNRADWASFRPLEAQAAAVDELLNETWTDLLVTLGYQWADLHAGIEGASKVTDLLDVSAGILAATTDLEDEAKTLAEVAIRMDGLKDSLEGESAISSGAHLREDPVLPELWNCYTVEDERAVHNTLLDRLAG